MGLLSIRLPTAIIIIGTIAGLDRNVISANTGNGIRVEQDRHGTLIEGNYIGTDATGQELLATA